MSAHMDTAVTVRPRLRCGEAGLHCLLRAPAQSLPDSHSRKNCSMRVNISFRCSLGNSLEPNGVPDSCPQHTTLAAPMDLCSLVIQAYCTNPASECQCPDYFPTTKPPMCSTETVSHWCPCIHFISIGHTLLRPMLDTCYITNINPNLFKSPQCCLPLPFSWDKSPWPLHSLQDLGTETSAHPHVILPTWTLPQPPMLYLAPAPGPLHWNSIHQGSVSPQKSLFLPSLRFQLNDTLVEDSSVSLLERTPGYILGAGDVIQLAECCLDTGHSGFHPKHCINTPHPFWHPGDGDGCIRCLGSTLDTWRIQRQPGL